MTSKQSKNSGISLSAKTCKVMMEDNNGYFFLVPLRGSKPQLLRQISPNSRVSVQKILHTNSGYSKFIKVERSNIATNYVFQLRERYIKLGNPMFVLLLLKKVASLFSSSCLTPWANGLCGRLIYRIGEQTRTFQC